ncbi:MAG: hypothetical protein WCQ54_01080 [Clostridiaceae bacterium]
MNVNPSKGYKVKDPIIRVVTESNGDIIDFDKVIAYFGSLFKIRLYYNLWLKNLTNLLQDNG